jgi:hypothetical protein
MNIDFDITNLVYIVLMIIFIIAGAFGKKKKPSKMVLPQEPADESAEDLLQMKIKEFYADFQVSQDEAPQVSYSGDEIIEEKYGPPLVEKSKEMIEQTLFTEYRSAQNIGSIEYEGEMLDAIGDEEGISNWNYEEQDYIEDEIKLSEGQELMPADYNEELAELLQHFDARQGLIYAEVLQRRDY